MEAHPLIAEHMKTPFARFSATLVLTLLAVVSSCSGSGKTDTPEVAQDTMLLHDLAQANRNTAAMDADTAIPAVVREQGSTSGSPAMIEPRRATDTPGPTRVPPVQAGEAIGDPCESPAAADQRTCLNRSIARADVSLNRVYQELIAQARISGGSGLEERFREAQRQWVFTRDNECRNQTRSQEGTLWASVRARCLADFSARRTGELQRSLNSLRGQ